VGEEVLVGTFFLHDQSIIILFDSRALHDFRSSSCAKKAKLSLVAIEEPFVICTLEGRVDADQIVQRVPLELSGWIFQTYLIVLCGQRTDVILGMIWMNLHVTP
jgi:hypothetical protein